MTVYIVTSGEYSDYGINAVFSTREEAEAFVATGVQAKVEEIGRSPSVEEWPVDDERGHVPRTEWQARIGLDSGLVYSLRTEVVFADPNARAGEASVYGDAFALARSYVSAEHAQKLGVEARQKWLREQAAP